jgi:hypothetical protein
VLGSALQQNVYSPEKCVGAGKLETGLSNLQANAMRIARTVIILFSVLCLSQTLLLNAGAQNIYKTVDEQGSVTFTDRPPMNGAVPVETVAGLDIQGTDEEELTARITASKEQLAAEDEADQVQRQEQTEEASQLAATEQERSENCTRATRILTKYTNSRRIYRSLENGERDYLNDSDLDAARAEAAQQVDEWCS